MRQSLAVVEVFELGHLVGLVTVEKLAEVSAVVSAEELVEVSAEELAVVMAAEVEADLELGPAFVAVVVVVGVQ